MRVGLEILRNNRVGVDGLGELVLGGGYLTGCGVFFGGYEYM